MNRTVWAFKNAAHEDKAFRERLQARAPRFRNGYQEYIPDADSALWTQLQTFHEECHEEALYRSIANRYNSWFPDDPDDVKIICFLRCSRFEDLNDDNDIALDCSRYDAFIDIPPRPSEEYFYPDLPDR